MQLYGIATMNKLKLNVCWITVLTWFSLGLKLLLPLGYLYTVSPNLSAFPLPFLHLSTLSLIFQIMFTSPLPLFRVAEVQFRTDGSDRTARTELSVQVQFWFWFGRQPAVQVRSSGFEKILRTGFEPVRTELNLYFF